MLTILIASALLAQTTPPLVAGRTVDLSRPGGFDYMAVDARYGRVFATHGGASTLAVLDLKSGATQEIEVGKVNGVQIDEALGRVFVAGSGQILVALDRKTLAKVGELALSGPGDDIAIDTKRQQIYVCHDDGEEDWVVDARTLKLVGSVKIAGAPEYVEYDAKTDRLYQNIKPTNQLQVIDPETKTVVAAWDTAPMQSPHGLALDRASGRAFSAGRNGKLDVFDIASGRLLTTVDIAPGTDQIAFDPILKRVYCPGRGALSVVQETPTGAVALGDVPAPAGAHTLAVDPRSHDVWVSYSNASGAHFAQFTVPRS